MLAFTGLIPMFAQSRVSTTKYCACSFRKSFMSIDFYVETEICISKLEYEIRQPFADLLCFP